MEHECDFNIETDLYIHEGFDKYRVVKTNNSCCVCLGINNAWDSHVLPCYHIAHTRCFRRWLYLRNKADCPICGKINWNIDIKNINVNDLISSDEIIIYDSQKYCFYTEMNSISFKNMRIYNGKNNRHNKIINLNREEFNNIDVANFNEYDCHNFSNKSKNVEFIIELSPRGFEGEMRYIDFCFNNGDYILKYGVGEHRYEYKIENVEFDRMKIYNIKKGKHNKLINILDNNLNKICCERINNINDYNFNNSLNEQYKKNANNEIDIVIELNSVLDKKIIVEIFYYKNLYKLIVKKV